MNTLNRLSTLSFAIIAGLSASVATAGNYYNDHAYSDTARVTHVQPIYKTVRVSSPERECWNEPHRYNKHQRHTQNESYTAAIAGGIIGGVIGNQFGGGSGKKALTVAGALLGGSVGNDYKNHTRNYSNDYSNGEQCRVTNRYREEERLDGYRVTYKYNGKTYTTRMDHDPGRRIPVSVSVTPQSNYY
jgi:uncharacterized protein YcfJ